MKSKTLPLFAVSRAAVLAAASTCIAFAGDGTWITDGNGDWSLPANWNGGTAANVADGSGFTANFTNNLTNDRTVNLDTPRTIGNLVFGDANNTSAGSWTLSGANILTLAGGTPTLTVSGLAVGKTATINSVIAGSSGLSKAGTGTLILTGANTYTGTTTVSSGVLSLNAAAPTVLGNLIMSGPDQTYARMQQPNQFGAGVVANFTSASAAWNRFELFGKNQSFAGINTGTLTTQGGGVIQNSEANGAAGAVATLTLNVNGTGPYVFNGHIRDYGNPAAGTHPLSLIKNGTGTQTLVGNVVSYSGSTTINGGTLELITTTAFKSPTTITSGSTLKLGNTADTGTPTTFTVALNSGGTLTHDGQSPNHFWLIGGAVTSAGSTTINQSSIATPAADHKNLFLDGGLKGSGTVTINAANAGNGVVFRNNNTSFSGTLIVNGIADTTVNLGSGIGVGGCSTGLQNTDIQLNGTMELLNQGVGWAAAASGTFQMGALSGTGAMVGNFTSAGSVTVTVGNGNHSGAFSGTIANGTGNTVHLVKTGSGTQTLSGTHSFTGNTTINGGSLAISGGSSLSDTGTLTLADAVDVQLVMNANETIGALSGGGSTGGNVNLQGNTLTLAGNANTSYAGVLSGTGGALAKTGTGTLTLSGVNTHSGATSIDAGTLNLTGSLPNSAMTVADLAKLSGEGSVASLTLGSSVGSDLVVVPSTAGALTATGPLSVSGETFVSLSGLVASPGFKVLQFGSNANGFTPANFILANSSEHRPGYAFTINANDVTLTLAKKSLEWTGSLDATWDLGSTANFRDTGTLADENFYTADEVLFGNVPATDQVISILGNVSPSSVTVNSSLNYSIGGGGIAGLGGLTKNGTGMLTLSGSNTYSGTTTVSGGTLDWNWSGESPQTLGGAVTVNSGGTFAMRAMANLSGGITVNNGGTFTWDTTTRAVDQGVGGKINIGAINIQSGGVFNLSNTKTVAYGTQDTLFNNQVLIGSGTVNQSGGGVVDWWTGSDLSGFSGTYNVQNGIFSLQCSTAANATTTATVNLTTGTGFLDLRTSNFACDKLTGGGIVGSSFSTALTLIVGTNQGSSTFDGIIQNGGIATGSGVIGLTKTGSGTFTLTGANTFTGSTTLNGGTLALNGGAALADTGAVVLANTAGVLLTLNASETIGSLAGGGSTGGNVNLQAHTLTVGNASNTSFAGGLSGTGGLTKAGTGTLTLTGSNTYSGNTSVNAGILSLNSAFLGDSSAVTLASGAILDLNTGASDTIGSLVLGGVTVPAGTYSASHPTYGSYFTGTGSLVVGGGAYDAWAASKGLAEGNKGLTMDPDNDGMKNLSEFYLDGNPLASDPSILPHSSLDATYITLTFKRRDDAEGSMASQIIEYGGNLSTWINATIGAASSPADGNGVIVSVTENGANPDDIRVQVPRSHAVAGKLFARLKLSATTP